MPEEKTHIQSPREQALGGLFDQYARDFFAPFIDETEDEETTPREADEEYSTDQAREIESKPGLP